MLDRSVAAGRRGGDCEYPSVPPRGAGPGRSAEGIRVLVVEDEALVALDIRSILEDAGYDVVAAVDTEHDAIAAAQRLSPDVVLMDIALAEGDGISAAHAMRGLRVPVVFLSGNADAATAARAAAAEPAGFIRKPFDSTHLVGALRAALRRTN